jgi:hypothetical protein
MRLAKQLQTFRISLLHKMTDCSLMFAVKVYAKPKQIFMLIYFCDIPTYSPWRIPFPRLGKICLKSYSRDPHTNKQFFLIGTKADQKSLNKKESFPQG